MAKRTRIKERQGNPMGLQRVENDSGRALLHSHFLAILHLLLHLFHFLPTCPPAFFHSASTDQAPASCQAWKEHEEPSPCTHQELPRGRGVQEGKEAICRGISAFL